VNGSGGSLVEVVWLVNQRNKHEVVLHVSKKLQSKGQVINVSVKERVDMEAKSI
jgi:hypothetical protein